MDDGFKGIERRWKTIQDKENHAFIVYRWWHLQLDYLLSFRSIGGTLELKKYLY